MYELGSISRKGICFEKKLKKNVLTIAHVKEFVLKFLILQDYV